MKINNKFRIFLMLLSLFLIVGSLSVLLPADRVTETCSHPRARVFSDGEVAADQTGAYVRQTEYLCDVCGAKFKHATELDGFAENLPTIEGGEVVFSGNWSVGYYVDDQYHPYNAVEVGKEWICDSSDVKNIWSSTAHGAFRVIGDTAPGFGLAYTNTTDCITLCYTAPKSGTVAIDFSDFKLDKTHNAAVPEFDIVCRGVSYLNGGINIYQTGYYSVEEMNEATKAVRISVRAGDEIYFTFRPTNSISLKDSTYVAPRVEYVDTPFAVLSCMDGCSFEKNGVCKKCGFVGTVKRFQLSVNPEASWGVIVEFVEGMTWREMQNSVFAHDRVRFSWYMSNALEVGILSAVDNTTVYVLQKNGKTVSPSDVIDPAGSYTWVEL